MAKTSSGSSTEALRTRTGPPKSASTRTGQKFQENTMFDKDLFQESAGITTETEKSGDRGDEHGTLGSSSEPPVGAKGKAACTAPTARSDDSSSKANTFASLFAEATRAKRSQTSRDLVSNHQ